MLIAYLLIRNKSHLTFYCKLLLQHCIINATAQEEILFEKNQCGENTRGGQEQHH
jgi:hypothetical protein